MIYLGFSLKRLTKKVASTVKNTVDQAKEQVTEIGGQGIKGAGKIASTAISQAPNVSKTVTTAVKASNTAIKKTAQAEVKNVRSAVKSVTVGVGDIAKTSGKAVIKSGGALVTAGTKPALALAKAGKSALDKVGDTVADVKNKIQQGFLGNIMSMKVFGIPVIALIIAVIIGFLLFLR